MSDNAAVEMVPYSAPSPLPAPYVPAAVMDTAYAKQLLATVEEVKRDVLVKDRDYGVIPGTGPKPTLLKPGAECLLQFFGFGCRVVRRELVHIEGRTTPVGAYYTMAVTRGELTVSECEGYAGLDEKAKDGRPKWKSWNTVVKMAQKRALVGATVLACRASGLFNIDLEDEREDWEPPNAEHD